MRRRVPLVVAHVRGDDVAVGVWEPDDNVVIASLGVDLDDLTSDACAAVTQCCGRLIGGRRTFHRDYEQVA